MDTCRYSGCNRKPNVSGKGYCREHYDQYRKYGKYFTIPRTIRDPNEIIMREDYAEVVIYNEKCEEVARSKIDKSDAERVSMFKWSMHNNGYVRKYSGRKTEYLHRFVLGLTSEDLEVDHMNRNKLDNRRSNLRTCEHCINAVNKDIKNPYGVAGVFNTKRNLEKPYVARITRNKKMHNLGYFKTGEEAARAITCLTQR